MLVPIGLQDLALNKLEVLGFDATSGAADIVNSLVQNSANDGEQSVEEAQAAVLASMNPSEIEDLRAMVHGDHIYSRLVQSIAPWSMDTRL